jgi:integrase
MLPVTIHTHLKSVAALRRGQSAASENDPVQPVPPEVVGATKPHLSRQIKALVELQLLTGARGGELLKLRPIDIQTDVPGPGRVWTIRPLDHKTAHHGHERTLFLGPKAQQVIQPFLTGRAADAYLFSPAEAERERRDAVSPSATPTVMARATAPTGSTSWLGGALPQVHRVQLATPTSTATSTPPISWPRSPRTA